MNKILKKKGFRIKARLRVAFRRIWKYFDSKYQNSTNEPPITDINLFALQSASHPSIGFSEFITEIEATVIIAFSYWVSNFLSADGFTEWLFKILEGGAVWRYTVFPILSRALSYFFVAVFPVIIRSVVLIIQAVIQAVIYFLRK